MLGGTKKVKMGLRKDSQPEKYGIQRKSKTIPKIKKYKLYYIKFLYFLFYKFKKKL